jgi:acyl-[acyl-carrier-protein]-phospholipid O-acyltransferase/long-chain-fatty-acid--[acyl-carrier-protein] ligase
VIKLLLSRRLLPLLSAQAFGAFADNMVKTALGVIALISLGEHGRALVPLAAAAIILPFLLFSAIAGEIAAAFGKSRIFKIVKCAEALGLGAAAYGLLTGNVAGLFAVLIMLGTAASFSSPLKYALLPEVFAGEALIAANGLIEASLFGAILTGTLLGGALAAAGQDTMLAGLAIGCGVAGAFSAWLVPPSEAPKHAKPVSLKIWRETRNLIADSRANRGVWRAILGISWFWTLGAVLMAEFPEIGEHISPDGAAIRYLLAAFSLGAAGGAALCPKLIRGEPIARFSPFLLIAMSFLILDAALVIQNMPYNPDGFLKQGQFWHLMTDIFLLASAGGLFSVPLYTLLQTLPAHNDIGRMIGANNAVNAIFMILGTVTASLLAVNGTTAAGILILLALANFIAAALLIRLLSRNALQLVFRGYLRLCHGMIVTGSDNLLKVTGAAVYICNHQSYADGAILAAFLPHDPQFVVNSFIARQWWARPFLALIDMFPVDPGRPHAINAMVKSLKAGRSIVIFPEGRLTRTGALMKVYDGSAMVADKAGVPIIPLRIDGPDLTPLSQVSGVKKRWFRKFTLAILPPRTIAVPAGLSLRARRKFLGEKLQDLMAETEFLTRHVDRSLFAAIIDAASLYGKSREIADDLDYKPLTYGRLMLAASLLGRRLDQLAPNGAVDDAVAVLLPNSVGLLVTFAGLQAFARPPLMLNFSHGPAAMLEICRVARIKTLVTSHRFAERGKLGDTIAQLQMEMQVVWLEDVRAGLGIFAKLRALLDARQPLKLPGAKTDPQKSCAILTTSGSTGMPKAVLLSHRNILSCLAQVSAAIDFSPNDRVVNALPMFHSFGLTGGTLVPLLKGIRNFYYPSPLHFRVIPEIIYDQEATIIFGTDTFLAGWGRHAGQYDFRSVRLGFTGAEKTRDETRKLFAERYGIRLMEAYGATEACLGIAANSPMHCVLGTVGRPFPGIETRIVPVSGIAEGGVLHIRGPNIMRGYIDPSKPDGIDAPEDGWYDTGDIVRIEENNYIRIIGRVKRFAKIGGERVSMDAAELLAASLWSDAAHAVVTMPDRRKGEAMVLLTTAATADLPGLLAHARHLGVGEIAIPRVILQVPEIPVLATGKTNYPAALAIAENLLASHAGAEPEHDDDNDDVA